MRKLSNAVDRFCIMHPNFGIPNLMRYVVIGTVAVYLLDLVTGGMGGVYQLLSFIPQLVLRGEVWRLVTFIFLPASGSALGLVLSLYFYYWMGTTLENHWGTAKFTIFYLSGLVLTVIGVMITALLTGQPTALVGTFYINMSMFFAFAALYPDAQVLLFFFIPIKIKWLAYLDGALFAVNIIEALVKGNWGGVVVPVLALLNFAVFFWPYFTKAVEYSQYRSSARTASRQFQQKVKTAQQTKGYTHKCTVCGRTDADHPELSFRYCSRCSGYHCYCEDHIFNHIHITDDK